MTIKIFLTIIAGFMAGAAVAQQAKISPTSLSNCHKCLLLTEQAENRLLIVQTQTKAILWEWKAAQANIAPPHVGWFNAISEAKPVYNGKFALITASAGAVALIRVADKKVLFYANAGNNPHSAEVLPDGNIVSVASTGNQLTVYRVDTSAVNHAGYKKVYFIKDGHNAVWDKTRQQLWATSGDTLKIFKYNNNCAKPELTATENIMLPAHGPHDLFPVTGEDAMWFTDVSHIYKFQLKTKIFAGFPASVQQHIKSVSSGPAGYPTIIMHPKAQWWSDEVTDIHGNSIYHLPGLKIYKARWFISNNFSYPARHAFKVCK